MSLFIEYGYTSLNHVGEELCGDMVDYKKNGDYLTLVLADGLGSGVKANILSTLTSKILSTMVNANISIEECIQTMVSTLPVCKERNLAYSTFSVVHINTNGEGYIFEFDNPEAILYHAGKCQNLKRELLSIPNKVVYKTNIKLSKDDIIIFMSDGAIHAGIGATMNFGWERKEIMDFLDNNIVKTKSARAIACQLASACNDLYLSKPGDDTTVACVKIREEVRVNIMVGPPVDKENDDFYVKKFLSDTDKTAVCGGTTSKIVARYLKTNVLSSFDFPDKDVPPTGHIDGVDLTTEGVLTLRKLLELYEKYISVKDLTPKVFTKKDGASLLANLLFEEGTHIQFFVGQSINTAHIGLPTDITMKLKLVETLAKNLQKMGKEVIVNYD